MILKKLSHSFENFSIYVENLSFDKGKIYALIGKNGAGKTTLMNAITNNLNLNGNIEMDIDENKILYIPTDLKAYEFLTVKEFINLLLKYNDTNSNYNYVIEKLNLKNKENELIANLSQGMSKKIALSPIFIRNFDFLILDEPFNSIDINYIFELKTYLKEISKDCSILISSHILDTLSDICDEFFIMKDGKIVKILDKSTEKLESEILECI
ncbi:MULTISPECIES: ABC transporter ATP-binding protein [unclassified Parvimonas]|uniref:ABC transporter ATP-binding protein n=1 Tax=unclassified Parvimonas TaxID=1151464 RepID=UPI002B483E01|nr:MULTISPECIES: ABC transporter ATP-binding protein [unclassified Parvimonas]MEB3024558.1 ABC transporter ATP-binding protein [Parvimonas sp. M13]MEB3088612.1 ABC transporter ATP-binding protein [Parvimonas sp. M20]